MIRRLLVLPLLALCLVLGACGDEGKKDIAVVDVARIARDSEPGKAMNAFLESIQTDFNDRLVAQQQVYQQNTEDAVARQTLETMFVSMQQRLQTEEQNATSILLERILQTINAFREGKGYSVILRNDVVLSHDKVVDVTDQVLAEVNKIVIEYKPVTTDQPGVDIPAVEVDGAADDAADEGANAQDGDAAAPDAAAETAAPAAEEFKSEADEADAAAGSVEKAAEDTKE